jgi:phosphatidylglycerophosphatase A
MDRLFLFIATGAGSGYLPLAPGTWGSAVGVLLWLAVSRLAMPAYLAVLGALFVIGVFSAGAAEKIVDRGDPGLVVIDEIVGQLIALAVAPPRPVAVLAGSVLFRPFAILIPFPVGWIDLQPLVGLGIMLDDAAAGLYALLVLQLGLWLFARL